MNRMIGSVLTAFIFFLCSVLPAYSLFAFDEVITVPAESPKGVILDLKKGEYIVTIEGGAMSLFYPINPNYKWLIGLSAGTSAKGYQDEPDIGTLYFEPSPSVYSQAEAERQAIKAAKENLNGTFLKFELKQDGRVRFWVSDFDYTDNSGMVKLKINSVMAPPESSSNLRE